MTNDDVVDVSRTKPRRRKDGGPTERSVEKIERHQKQTYAAVCIEFWTRKKQRDTMSNPQKKIKLDPERSVPLEAALFPDILLYCAKPQEFEYVREYFATEQDAVQIQGFVSTPRSGTSSILGTFGDGASRQSFVLCHGAIQGPEVAAATLAICLCDFQPSYFAMLGMCAGKPKLAQFCVVCGYGASNVDERKDKPAHTEKVNRGSYEVLAATICESLEANPPKDADGNPLPVTLESGTVMSGASVDETGKVFEKSVRYAVNSASTSTSVFDVPTCNLRW